MNTYRSLMTIQAVQYAGEPIPGVTCEPLADKEEEARRREQNGCDSSRANLPHVHASVPGGMITLKESDWIVPVPGGPFAVFSDAQFRAGWEAPSGVVPDDKPARPATVAAPAAEPEQVRPEPAAEGSFQEILAGRSEEKFTGRPAQTGKGGTKVRGAGGA